jgi:hypothetical protein
VAAQSVPTPSLGGNLTFVLINPVQAAIGFAQCQLKLIKADMNVVWGRFVLVHLWLILKL